MDNEPKPTTRQEAQEALEVLKTYAAEHATPGRAETFRDAQRADQLPGAVETLETLLGAAGE